MPFLSVIIPVYNAEKYLSRCFDSIITQTFKDYEVIIIDDGSTDQSPEICDRYAIKDDRFRVFHVKNGGPSKARNTGFLKSEGEYIYCIDNDDYISGEHYFQIIYDSLKKNPVEILQMGASYYRESADCIVKVLDYIELEDLEINKPSHTIYSLISKRKYETSCWTKVIKKDFLIDNDYFFDEELVVEDLDWNMNFLRGIKTYNVLNCSSYMHVFRDGSIAASHGKQSYKNCMDQIVTINRWANYYQTYTENKELKTAALSFLCYQMFITMGRSVKLDKAYQKTVKNELKRMKYLTNYAIEKSQKVLCFVYKILGYQIVSKVLGYYFYRARK